ncbi:MAG TPA: adenylate/guanylate cyclase domain-containing protein [Gaiellaceae bacterium]|nr:adenylate/guanylate cyclase domain-containing protein [Gaiellaceae bacterium]
MLAPDVHYARSGDVSIAYQVLGDGPLDVVIVRGSLAHLDSVWEQPLFVQHVERLASFARVLLFDKRGMGLSDRLRSVPTLEARMDDVRAVMDAAGMDRAALFGAHEGTRLAILFAATYPERTAALVLFDPSPKGRRSPDYPWARSDEEWRDWLREVGESWGTPEFFARQLREYTPTRADDEEFRAWYARHMRQSASPGAAVAFQRMVMDGDVTDVLPAIRVPTLVLHRAASAGPAAYVAERIPDAVRRDVPGLVDGFSWADPAGNGRLLDEAEEFLRGLDRAAAPERVLATILFTDIVDSTRKAAELGDAGWRELLGRHNALVRRRLSEFRGTELNTTGDGFVASFDGPLRGLSCAGAIRDEVRELGLEIRAGLHTGEGELSGGRVGGIVLHIAARVAAAAGPGEVFVSGTVKDLVAGSGVEFADCGAHVLKGVPGEWRLFAVREAGTVPASR